MQSVVARRHPARGPSYQVTSEDLAVLCPWTAAGWGPWRGHSQGGGSAKQPARMSAELWFMVVSLSSASGLFYGPLCSWSHTSNGVRPLRSLSAFMGHSGIWRAPECLLRERGEPAGGNLWFPGKPEALRRKCWIPAVYFRSAILEEGNDSHILVP